MARSAIVSVVAQKSGAPLDVTHGAAEVEAYQDIWVMRCWGYNEYKFGTSSAQIQTRMYASEMLVLLMKTGPRCGSALKMQCRRRGSAWPNCMVSCGAVGVTASLRPM